MDELFAKTAKGYDEVETKAGGLSPVLRRVLIFVNGKRTLEELSTLPRVDDLNNILLELERGGYISRLSSTVAPPPAVSTPAVVAVPPAIAGDFRPLPATNSPLQIQQVRNFMVNTLNVFVGAFGMTALAGRLNNAQTHTELRALFPEWYTAILGSREGRREAEKLRAELLKVI